MPDAPRTFEARLRASLSVLGRGVRLIAPLILVMLGLALGLVSLTSEQSTLYTNTYSGTLAPGNVTVDLPAVNPGVLQLVVITGACDVRIYPATDAQATAFADTGTLPAFWMGCANRTASVSGQVRHLIFLNVGLASLPYEISVLAYSIRTPLGWLALPATVFVLIGLITFLPRMMAGEVVRMRESFERKEKKRKERK